MNAVRAYTVLGALLGLMLVGSAATAKTKSDDGLSNACVSTKSKEALAECPKGPKNFDIKKKRAVAFKSAPPPREVRDRRDTKPRDPTEEMSSSFRDTRKTKLQARARALLITEIQGLERLFSNTKKKSPDRQQLIRRLAEGYVELETAALRDKNFAEVEVQNIKAAAKKRKKRPSSAKIAELQRDAKNAQKIVEVARKKAIAYYTRMKMEFPNYSKLDEVLYYLAYEYEQARDLQNARKVYYELIEKAPKSPYVPNAYLAFGELFFIEAQGDPNKWDLAAAAYSEVTKYPPPDNKVYGYARYKLGYVYWNQNNYVQALNEFKHVIEYGNKYPELPNATQLAKSARRDLIPVYAVKGDPKRAYGFFKPLSGDTGGGDRKTIEMLNDLGYAYLDTGHYPEAIELYQDLMVRDKGDRYCLYQSQITSAVSAMNSANKERIKDELDKQLQVRKDFVSGQHSPKSKLECSNKTAELLAETAMSWHLEAVGSGGVRGTGDKNTMDLAAYVYKKVADNFTSQDFDKFEFPRIVKEDWPTLYKIKYAMADLLYFQERWKDCGPAFDAVVDEDPKGADAAEAAYASVLCYQKMYDQMYAGDKDKQSKGLGPKGASAEDRKAQKGEWEKFKPKDLDEMQKGMIQAFNRYVCYIQPKQGDSEAEEQYMDVKYARARTYFEAQHWEEAAIGFRDIALNYADKDAGIYAAQLYLEAINVLGAKAEPPRPECYDDMAEDVPAFLELYCKGDKFKDNEDQCQLLTRIQFDVLRLRAQKTVELADQQADKGNYREALENYKKGGDQYLDIWRTYCEAPMSAGDKPAQCETADEIVYNMAKAYQAGRLLAKSIQARLILLNPKYGMQESEWAKRATYEIGGNYQAIAVYDKAAEFFEKYAEDTKFRGEFADKALSDAVVLRLGLGMEEEAIEDAKNFNRYFGQKKKEQAAQIAFAVAAHYAEKKDWKNAQQNLTRGMGLIDRQATLDVQVQAHALLGHVYAQQKNAGPAGREYQKVVALWKDPKKAVASIESIPEESEGGKMRRLGRALEAVGEALFFFAEEQREKKVDKLKFPEYKGKKDKESITKHIGTNVKDWYEKKAKAIKEVAEDYKRIVDLQPTPPPRWVIAAGSRVGEMWGTFVKDFRSAPIPKEWEKDYEIRTAYYGSLDDASEPYKKGARGAYEVCLGYSVKYQYFDEFSRACEEWLAENYKAEFHLIDEFRGAPTRVNSALREQPQPLRIGGEPMVQAPTAPEVQKKAEDQQEK